MAETFCLTSQRLLAGLVHRRSLLAALNAILYLMVAGDISRYSHEQQYYRVRLRVLALR
jgi:hypothetical protein